MITLAFDSTAKVATCAVVRDGEMLAEYTVNNGFTQSELLLPMAEAMLSQLKINIKDVDLLATSVGPGSFTGVRIGTALIKGLAFANGTPTIGVSALEALAYNMRDMYGIVVPVMDAKRSQVYTAIFEAKWGQLTRISEDMAISLAELSDKLGLYLDDRIYLVGDGYDVAFPYLVESVTPVVTTPKMTRLQSAASVALLAEEKYKANGATPDTEILPSYLRVPQAERERLERLKNNT